MPKDKRPRAAAIPPDPPGFKPVTRDDMSDLALLPQLFRQFVAMYRADFDWLKEMLKAISIDTDSLKRRADRQEERIGTLERRHEFYEACQREFGERLERLEGEAKKGQGQ